MHQAGWAPSQMQLRRRSMILAPAVLEWMTSGTAAATAQSKPLPLILETDADIENALPLLSNWKRWGADDQLGTLNLITPAMRIAAAQSVRSGRAVALGREFAADTPGMREFSYRMIRYNDALPEEAGSRDVVTIMCHGFAITHVDALCHIFTPAGEQGMYNSYPVSDVTPAGAIRLGIEKIGEQGIVGRGVLLDIAELRGGALPPGSAINPQDLEEAEQRHGVRVGEGDILFVRNGAGAQNTHRLGTGLSASCLPWLRARGVSVLSSDSDSDVHPPPARLTRWVEPIHMVGIPFMGLTLLDNSGLDELASACAAERRWHFFVSAAPWRLKGATGCAINPIAVF
jgi:kynurenine formamidase